MARIPSPESISGPDSFRPNAPAPVGDFSAIGKGLSNLGGSVTQIVREEQEKQNVIDFAAADAFATRQFLDMQNRFEEDGDYATFTERAERGSQSIASGAAEMIRDPRARQQWVAANEVNRLRQVDGINDKGRALANEAERVQFLSSLEDYAGLITEPSTPDDVRERTRISLAGTIDMALANGLLTPAEAQTARTQFIDGAEERLSLNRADALIREDPQAVISGTGIGPTGDPLNDARTAVTLPIVAGPGVNVADVDPAVLGRFEQVQSVFGTQLPVISGVRTGAHNDAVGGAGNSRHEEENGGDAIDIDVSSLSKEERVRLIETASAMGFTGIGVYANSLHLDTGNTRAWGPSYGSKSVPSWAKDVIDRHTSGGIAEVPVAAARGIDPRFAALSYEQRASIFDQAKAAQEQGAMQMRVGIETTAQNAPLAIARQGEYSGNLPTANDFVQAYGAQDGIEKFEAFDASVKVAQDTFAMRTMSTEEISGLIEQAVPTSTGDDALAQEQRFAQLAKAAEETIKARAEDPAGYVMSAYPAVADAWAATENDDANGTRTKIAIATTAMAQEALGMDTLMLLPKGMAAGIAAQFNNTTLPDEQRTGMFTGIIQTASNPQHAVAIFDQLITAGVPPTVRPAMEALSRPGGEGPAQRLFRAAMAPTEELNKALPDDIQPSKVSEGVQAVVFDEGSVGNIYYDLTFGSVANNEEAMQGMAVFNNSVKMRLIDGSAGGNLQTAIDLTAKDMFGDVEVVNGSASGGRAGMKILLPKGEDRAPYQAGFDALMGAVGEAHAASLEDDVESIYGPVEPGTAGRAIREAQLAAMVEQGLAGGYFTGAGEGQFKFIDPNTQAPVIGRDGQPLIFTQQEVMTAGSEAQTLSTAPAMPATEQDAAIQSEWKQLRNQALSDAVGGQQAQSLHPFDPAINTPRPNDDGSISTEITRTVQFPDGSWANVPSLWWGSGSDVQDFDSMSDDELADFAAKFEQTGGTKFPRFSNLSDAEKAARARSNDGGGTQGRTDQ